MSTVKPIQTDASAPLPYRASFSREQFEIIRRGLEALEMEDKWNIHMKDDQLHFVRSWTGYWVYRVRFQRNGDRHDVAQAIVSTDSNVYHRDTDEREVALLDFLIRALLLHEDIEFPVPADMSPEVAGILEHHVAGTAYPTRPIRDTLWSRVRRFVSALFTPASRVEDDSDEPAAFGTTLQRNTEYYPHSSMASALIVVPPYLRVMGEPPLAPGNAVHGDTYRLVSLPSFSPAVSVRIDDSGVTARAWLGAPIEGRGKRILDSARPVGAPERATFGALLDATQFWQMTPAGGPQGLDGTTWVLEGRRGDDHHVVLRWSPRETGADPEFARLGEFMVSLAPDVVLPDPSPKERREIERRDRIMEEERDARERERAARIARSNQLTAQVRDDLARGKSVVCPNCRTATTSMRFVAVGAGRESYLVCDRCGRSCTGWEIHPDRPPSP